jgi:hypothetical protein
MQDERRQLLTRFAAEGSSGVQAVTELWRIEPQ